MEGKTVALKQSEEELLTMKTKYAIQSQKEVIEEFLETRKWAIERNKQTSEIKERDALRKEYLANFRIVVSKTKDFILEQKGP